MLEWRVGHTGCEEMMSWEAVEPWRRWVVIGSESVGCAEIVVEGSDIVVRGRAVMVVDDGRLYLRMYRGRESGCSAGMSKVVG